MDWYSGRNLTALEESAAFIQVETDNDYGLRQPRVVSTVPE